MASAGSKEKLSSLPWLTDKETIIQQLSALLKQSVAPFTATRVAIAFSGGIDSTLLAHLFAQKSPRYVLYAVGLEGASDLKQAEFVARRMNFPLKKKVMSGAEAQQALARAVNILRKAGLVCTPVDVAIAAPLLAVLAMAQADRITTVLYGLGADSLFAGFERHTKYKRDFQREHIQQQLLRSLSHLEAIENVRDQALAKEFRRTLHAPFIHPSLVAYAMRIDPVLKVNQTEKKIILREAAIALGIPRDSAFQKKIAIQYGSGFSKLMQQCAKDRGYATSQKYLASLSG